MIIFKTLRSTDMLFLYHSEFIAIFSFKSVTVFPLLIESCQTNPSTISLVNTNVQYLPPAKSAHIYACA
jgi:hypothetical protein